MPDPSDPPRPPPDRSHPALKPVLGGFILLGFVIAVIFLPIQSLLAQALENFRNLGPWGPILFIAIYILACVLFIPGSLITLAAGAIYGPIWGTLYVSTGSTLGATASFLLGRFLARDWIARKLAQHQGMQRLDTAVAQDGWKIVGLTRLSPIFPFALLNYAYGLTRVSVRDYVLASWIGMLPGTILYVYIGSLAGELGKLGATDRTRTPVEWAFYGLGLLATVAVSLYITRLARSALANRLPTSIPATNRAPSATIQDPSPDKPHSTSRSSPPDSSQKQPPI